MRRFFNRRTLTITAISLCALVAILALAAFLWVRSNSFNNWVAEQMKTALAEFGIRAEIGAVKPGFRDLSVELKDVKLFAKDDKEPFAAFDQLNGTVKFRDLLKRHAPTEVSLQNLKIDGLKFWYKVDANGVSNLSKLDFTSKGKTQREDIEFDYAAANVELTRAEIFYVDTMRKLDGAARNLAVKITPDRDKFFRIVASADNSTFTLDGQETNDISFKLNSLANETGAVVESLTTTSPLVNAEMKGEMKSWDKLDYTLDAKAVVKMNEVTRIFAPDTRINGTAQFEGKVVGTGVDYQADGKLTSNNIVARDVRIEGLHLKFNGKGQGAEFEADEELLFQKLDAAGFKVNRVAAMGRIAGNGEDFTWLLNFKAGDLSGPDVRASGISFSNAKVNFRADDFSKFKATGKARVEHLVTANVDIGNITGDVTATRSEVIVPNFSGAVFGGNANGSARVRLDGKGTSEVQANLAALNLDKASAVTAGKRLPLRGTADGKVNLAWNGFDFKTAEGTANLKFKGSTIAQEGTEGAGLLEGLPITGELNAIASQRRLKINNTIIQSGATTLTASGDIGWDKSGALDITLNSGDAAELQTLVLDLTRNLNPEAIKEFTEQEIQLTNKMSFIGRVTGSLEKPQVSGRVKFDAVNWHDEPLGEIAANINYAGDALKIDDGLLTQPDRGQAQFAVDVPFNVKNGIAVRTNLKGLSLASALKAALSLPVEIEGLANGQAEITGLPEAMRGTAEIKIANGRYGTKAIESFTSKLTLDGSKIDLTELNLRTGESAVAGTVNFDTKTKGYRAKLQGEGIDLNEWVNIALEENEPRIPLTGRVNINLEAEAAEFKLDEKAGRIFDRLEATATSKEIVYKNEPVRNAVLTINGKDSVAKLDIKADALSQSHTGAGEIDFSKPEMPINLALNFKDLEVARVLDLASASDLQATGKASGQVRIAGNLASKADPLRVETEFSGLYFDVTDYRLTAQTPFTLKVNADQVDLGSIRLSGNNTNVNVRGTLALSEAGRNTLSINGDVNLKLIQTFVKDVFADGLVKLEGEARGTFKQPRFSGTATLQDGSLRIPGFPVGMNRARGRLLFTADQAQLASFEADVGTGKIKATGGASFAGFKPNRWRFQIKPEGVRVDYPRDVRATLDGDLELQGSREFQLLSGTVNVRRTEYLAEVDLFEFIEKITEQFGNPSIGGAAADDSAFPPTQMDIRVVANETLNLRTKLLDITGSLALRLRGPIDDPTVGGRITVSRGILDNIFSQRFRIANAGTIEFPGVEKRTGQMNIEAESDIKGYRVIANFSGALNQPRFRLRSEPSLPEPEVYNLVATGRLQNEDRLSSSSSSQAIAQTSLNTAASFIANRASRTVESNVTSRLFGLNRFSVDPLLTGRGTDPTARVTVGRRITKDLSITYSTNIASNQDQVILIEYQASDKLSFVASRAQDGSFGLDVRLRKRF
jgi:translocation and assembly module TamB